MWRLAAGLIRGQWRTSAATAAGVAVASAVVTGSLIVGDSVRGSLRRLTAERLGRIETLVSPGRFFAADRFEDGAAVVLLPGGTVEAGDRDGGVRRAGRVQVLGVDSGFGGLDPTGVVDGVPRRGTVWVNRTLADQLNAGEGDEVIVRLPDRGAVPADSPLGRREIRTRSLPGMRVAKVLPDRGLATFAVTPAQTPPPIVFVRRDEVGEVLNRGDSANAVLSTGDGIDLSRLELADLGLSLVDAEQPFAPEAGAAPVFAYRSLVSDRLLVPAGVSDAVTEGFGGDATPVLVHLANALTFGDAEVPYSIVAAVDDTPSLPLNYGDAQTPVVLNSWAAERLGAGVGDTVSMAYYRPETIDGRPEEVTVSMTVTDVVPITEPATPYRRNRRATFDSPPTVYNDPFLTPTVPGITDQRSISDWDLPFELDRQTTRDDDEYWNRHRLTPKAFVPRRIGLEWFAGRFGDVTSVRLPAGTDEADVMAVLRPRLESLGWAAVPIGVMQRRASAGTTPFDGLFLALGFFIIAGALILVAMLTRLAWEDRSAVLGVMTASGWRPGRVLRLVAAESLLVAAVGAVFGGALGVVYARAILSTLSTRWVGAVASPFLEYHASGRSLVLGPVLAASAGVVVALVTTRRAVRRTPRNLLRGGGDGDSGARGGLVWGGAAVAGAVIAAAMTWATVGRGGMAAAGLAVGAAFLWAAAGVAAMRWWMTADGDGGSVMRLAVSGVRRHPTRSLLAVSLMTLASLLPVAMTAFAARPSAGGTGGFDYVGRSSVPLTPDLSDPPVASEIASGFGGEVYPVRTHGGADASCVNLYAAASTPTVLGVDRRFVETSGAAFDWADAGDDGWSTLLRPATGTADDPMPIILDENTALWSLKMTGGVGERRVKTIDGEEVHFVVAGLLRNTILQGALIVGEANYTRLFPDDSGDSLFLIRGEAADAAALEDRLGDVGMDVRPAADVLAELLAVQNTYLRAFQSLGVLGLLLGLFGLVVAQVRGVLVRRGELATMRAAGFSRGRLAALILAETAVLVITGIGIGVAAAVLGLLPALLGYAAVGGGISGVGPVVSVATVAAIGIAVAWFVSDRVSRMPLVESLRSAA